MTTEDVHWLVSHDARGKGVFEPLLEPADLLNQPAPKKFFYRYKAAHAAMGLLMDGSAAVRIHRVPEFSEKPQTEKPPQAEEIL